MFYDLNVPWTTNQAETQQKISFLSELGYNCLALSHTLSGKLPPTLTCPIPDPLPFKTPQGVQILRRTNIVLTDSSQNFRITELNNLSDIFAVRPTDEKTLQHACHSLECDIISLDLSVRYYFRFKHKSLNEAISRGVRIELCYSPVSSSHSDVAARRNLIANATALIRATRGRGLIISSECRDALGARGPWDAVNLCVVWGLGQERGYEAISKEARSCVVAAKLRRTSYRGAVDVIYGGEKPEVTTTTTTTTTTKKAKGKSGGDPATASKGKTGQAVGKQQQQQQSRQQKTNGKGNAGTPSNDAKRKADAIAPSIGDTPLSNRAKKKLARQQNAVSSDKPPP